MFILIMSPKRETATKYYIIYFKKENIRNLYIYRTVCIIEFISRYIFSEEMIVARVFHEERFDPCYQSCPSVN